MIVRRLSSRAPGLSSIISNEFYQSPHVLGSVSSSPDISGESKRPLSTVALANRKGTGGRSSVSGYVATVFGATGFLGRYVVQQLAKMGSQVYVPWRGLEDVPRHLKLMGDLGQIVPINLDVRDEESIKAAMARSNVVINLIGKDYETNNFSFQELNVDIPDTISRLAKEHGNIGRYVHVSALGASPTNPAQQYRTKAAGEQIVAKNFPEATILRPAHMVGTEDRLLNRWATWVKRVGAVPVLGDGTNKLQPVHVTDVAAAAVTAVVDDGGSAGKTFELGGPDIFTINELVDLTFDAIREEPRVIHFPYPVSQWVTAAEPYITKLPFPTPKMITFSRNSADAMQADYVVSPDALAFGDLGIYPRKIEGVTIEHLYAYRTGGPGKGTTMTEGTIPTPGKH